MKTCIAVISHEGAAQTVSEFMPRWKKLGLPIIGFLPEGHSCTEFDRIIHCGESAHSGPEIFRRFILVCRCLHALGEFDRYVLMEYDTVNLSDNLPRVDWSRLNCGMMPTFGDVPGGIYSVSMSPWIMDRANLLRLIHAMEAYAGTYSTWIRGLLDRWLSVVITEADLPCQSIAQLIPFPFPQIDPLALLRSGAWTWVHGWKRSEDFGEFWPLANTEVRDGGRSA